MLPLGDGWNGWVRYHPLHSAEPTGRVMSRPLQRLVSKVRLLCTQLDSSSRHDKYHSGGLNNTVVFLVACVIRIPLSVVRGHGDQTKQHGFWLGEPAR